MAYYGWYEIRVQHDPTTQDPVIDAAGTVQRAIAEFLDTLGTAAIAVVFAGLLITVAALARRRRTRRTRGTETGGRQAPGRAS
ncbi:hypothetical protein [Streptomyces capitiformicae]|uniref:Uncharacterized protein n=1 Tax=Streptomyces capitiformicae TaxID=2014920 RepID=A0A918ZQ33_9ACTN|nr:hypothetical protein [Streptomyces capitiformicae]GHE62878.1 hypothetical protein GCM10017771_86130 [Streptomyces capitiformicae]